MASSVRVAGVGCGFFAGNHYNSWNDLKGEGAELVAVCDIDAKKAEVTAKKFGVPKWYTDFDEMLAKEKIDLLDVITRMDTHRMLVEKSIGKKIATIVQKPFAPDWNDCVAMTAAADKASVFLAVHENFRFQAPLIRVKRVIESGEIGAPTWARVSFRTGYDIYSGQPYFYDEIRFIILDLGIHTLDIARFLLGEVDLVSCQTQRRNPKVKAEDTVTAILRHTSGAVSVNDFSYESRRLPDTFPNTLLEIEGPKGAIVVDNDFKMRVAVDGKLRLEDLGTPLLSWTSHPWHVAQESVLNTCRNMLSAFRTGRDADTSARDNLKTYAVAEACYESAEKGTMVHPRHFP
ncbi:MAG: Gfo/Idh/MocA family oxidoreductase [Bauldia sp.]